MSPTNDPQASRDAVVTAEAPAARLDAGHLRRVLDAIPTPVSYVDTELRFRYNNRAYDAWTGVPHEQLYGRHIREALGEKAYTEVLPYAEQALSGREANFERELEYSDGTRRYVSVSYVPDFDDAGSVRGFVAHIRDLTARRRAEESMRFQAQLLDTVEQAVIATDLEGRISYWNRYAEKLYGWPAGEAVGRSVLEMTPAETSAGQAAEIMSRLLAGEAWSGEFVVRRRDGSCFPAMVIDS